MAGQSHGQDIVAERCLAPAARARPRGRRLGARGSRGTNGGRLPTSHRHWRSDMMPSHAVRWHFRGTSALLANVQVLGCAYCSHGPSKIALSMLCSSSFAASVFAERLVCWHCSRHACVGTWARSSAPAPFPETFGAAATAISCVCAPQSSGAVWRPTGPVAQRAGHRPEGLGNGAARGRPQPWRGAAAGGGGHSAKMGTGREWVAVGWLP